MKAIGKIGNITVDFRSQKTAKDGAPYISERVTIFFEAGDDIHMVQVLNSLFGVRSTEDPDINQKSAEALAKRNIFIGARGEMTITYGFRNYQGRNYPDVQLVRWTCDNPQREPDAAPASAPTDQPEATSQQVAAGMAEAAAAHEGEVNPETGLPF